MFKIIGKKIGPLYNIEFDKLFLGQLFSHFSDAVIQFCLIAILINTLPNAGRAIALTLFSFLLPQFLLSPFAGILCDKFSRKLILSISSLYRCLILVLFIEIFYLNNNFIFTRYRKCIFLSRKNVNSAEHC